MESKDNFTPTMVADLAEAILLLPDRLPIGIEGELSTLRQMLEKAVQGKELAEPVPPAYGKIACPATEDVADENILHLREDTMVQEKTKMITLSPRREGDYITVPQVVRGQTVVREQTGGDHA